MDSWFGDGIRGLNCAAGNQFDTYTPLIDHFLTRHRSVSAAEEAIFRETQSDVSVAQWIAIPPSSGSSGDG